jgi:catechol 2,3-dioxygenase-like lactoylglutathione lyase family enzyme
MKWNALVPELVVADYEQSKAFYVDVFGFSVRFERPESRFGYFDLGGAQIMLLGDTNRPIYQMHRYRQDTLLHGQKEFFVADPDGYLYRFHEYIGERRAS